jgi:hypothetical protein
MASLFYAAARESICSRFVAVCEGGRPFVVCQEDLAKAPFF